MKFYWKLYFSIMLITVACFSIGGYGLIQVGFNTSLQREIDTAYQENDILFAALQRELVSKPIDYYLVELSDTERIEALQESIATLTIQTFSGNMFFCLRSSDGDLIYQNGGFEDDRSFIDEIDNDERGYKIVQNKNGYQINVLRVLEIEGMETYVENARDISSVFKMRDEQCRTYLYCIGLLIVVSVGVIFVVTRWLVRPIKDLSQATKKIAKGELNEELVVYSEDEIGQLTKDFNSMSNQLQQTISKLQETIENQEIFIGDFAHELKTPLTSIIGYGNMLRAKCLSEETVSYANLIVQEGKRLEGLSMKLLELIVLQKEEFKFQKVSAVEFLEQIKETVIFMMEDAKIDFDVKIEEAEIEIEPDLMKTVCLNLLDNARKAVGENARIELSGKMDKNGYRIIVSDNGCGIDGKELGKVKEVFYMVDKSRSRSAGGAGLGLAICEQIIKLHHGRIEIESQLNKGTVVTIYLNRRGLDETD